MSSNNTFSVLFGDTILLNVKNVYTFCIGAILSGTISG